MHKSCSVLLALLFYSISLATQVDSFDIEPSAEVCHEASSEQESLLKWERLRPTDIQQIKLAVIPLGSVEHHGPHLPLGTDLLIANAITEHALQGISVAAILPATPYGASFEHYNKLGTIAIKDMPLNRMWNNILSSLPNSSIRKVLLVNAHGGQTPNVDVAIRNFRFSENALAVSFNIQAAMALAWRTTETRHDLMEMELQYGIHGGLIETSVMLHLHPELVSMSEAKNFTPSWSFASSSLQPYGDIVSYGWRSEDICAEGAIGNAAAASAELGGEIFTKVVHRLRQLVLEIVEVDVSQIVP